MCPKALAAAEANEDSACSHPSSVINERLRNSTRPEGCRLYCRPHRVGHKVGTVKDASGCHHGIRQAHIKRDTHRHGENVDYSQQNVSWVEHPRRSAECADGQFILRTPLRAEENQGCLPMLQTNLYHVPSMCPNMLKVRSRIRQKPSRTSQGSFPNLRGRVAGVISADGLAYPFLHGTLRPRWPSAAMGHPTHSLLGKQRTVDSTDVVRTSCGYSVHDHA